MYLRNSASTSYLDEYPYASTESAAAVSYQTQTTKFVCGNELLNSLPPEILRELQPWLRRVKLSKEHFLFQQDDEIDSIYFPESAIMSEFHLTEDGRMVEVALTGRDSVIGLSGLFKADHVPNCVQVIQAGTALEIEAAKMRQIASQSPKLMTLLFGGLEHYIRQISQKAVCNMYHTLEARFCTWLLRFNDQSSRDIFKLTHEQLARILGVYRPSVTCIALEMKKRSLIDYSRGGISIRNRRRIEDLACGCYLEMQSAA